MSSHLSGKAKTTVLTAAAAHQNAHRVNMNAKILIPIIVQEDTGIQENTVQTAAIPRQGCALHAQQENINATNIIH